MALDVEAPEPPDLTNRGVPAAVDPDSLTGEADLRRADVEGFLRDGAWHEAFEEWAEYTDLAAAQVQTLEAAGAFAAMDVYWNPQEGELDFEVPSVPADLPAAAPDDVDAATAERELREFGRTIVEMLEDAYLDWGEEAVEDPVWGPDRLRPDADEPDTEPE